MIKCPKCAVENEQTAMTCNSCGASFGEKPAQPSQPTGTLRNTYHYTYAKELISSSNMTKTQVMKKLVDMGVDEAIANSMIRDIDKEALAATVVKGKGDTSVVSSRSAKSVSKPKPSSKILVFAVSLAIAATLAAIIYWKGFASSVKEAERSQPAEKGFDDPNAYMKLAKAECVKGNLAGAIDEYDKAIQMNPTLVEAYYERGGVKYRLCDYEGAIKDYDKVILMSPNMAGTYNYRAAAESKIGNYKAALADWEKAIKLNPSYKSILQSQIDDAKTKLKSFND